MPSKEIRKLTKTGRGSKYVTEDINIFYEKRVKCGIIKTLDNQNV